MKILWLVNIALPEASKLMHEEVIPFGGWLVNSSTYISNLEDVELIVAFPKKGISKNLELIGNKIRYIAFPEIQYFDVEGNQKNENLDIILKDVKPDIVHIFGTERAHSLPMVNTCKENEIKSIISIQGLVSIYEKHYMAGLPYNVQNRYSFRDLIKLDNLVMQKNKFSKSGKYEINAIKKSEHIIGRTTWDKACIYQINHHCKYYSCNESLRESFYLNEWDQNSCEEYSIFTSQASYPIKGIHFILEAMPIILKFYPKAKLYIAGQNIFGKTGQFGKLKMTSYSKYIYELIKKYSLEDNIVFTGVLDEKGICDRYLNSNVFVLPSSIENSPNSLGEAMIMGVPCVAAYVGGTPDMLKHDEEGFLYQYDAPYMLAHYVCKIFENKKLAKKISVSARARGLSTHNIKNNTNVLLGIYNNVVGEVE